MWGLPCSCRASAPAAPAPDESLRAQPPADVSLQSLAGGPARTCIGAGPVAGSGHLGQVSSPGAGARQPVTLAAGPGRLCRHHGRWSDRDVGIGALKRLSISTRPTREPRTRRAFSGFYRPNEFRTESGGRSTAAGTEFGVSREWGDWSFACYARTRAVVASTRRVIKARHFVEPTAAEGAISDRARATSSRCCPYPRPARIRIG